MHKTEAERLFTGALAAEYEKLKLICPAAAEMSLKVGEYVAEWNPGRPLSVFEIGCGTGITTQALLQFRHDLNIVAVDNEPMMLDQARHNLADALRQQRLKLIEVDALAGLQALNDASMDVVASAYAVHNFLQDYRDRVLTEIFRVLKPGGVFVNGDRYALDDSLAHTRLTQEELRHYFKTFLAIDRLDLLEQWVVHLFSDESPDHIMPLQRSLIRMRALGFEPVTTLYREGVNTLLVAMRP